MIPPAAVRQVGRVTRVRSVGVTTDASRAQRESTTAPSCSVCATLVGQDQRVRSVQTSAAQPAHALNLARASMGACSTRQHAPATVPLVLTGQVATAEHAPHLGQVRCAHSPSHSSTSPPVRVNVTRTSCSSCRVRMGACSMRTAAAATARSRGAVRVAQSVAKRSGIATTEDSGTISTASVTVTRRGALRIGVSPVPFSTARTGGCSCRTSAAAVAKGSGLVTNATSALRFKSSSSPAWTASTVGFQKTLARATKSVLRENVCTEASKTRRHVLAIATHRRRRGEAFQVPSVPVGHCNQRAWVAVFRVPSLRRPKRVHRLLK